MGIDGLPGPPDLCSAIMGDRKTFVETANDLQESFQEIETRAVAAYYHFVQDENKKGMAVNTAPAGLIDSHFTALAPKKPSPTKKWPDFDFEMFRDTLGNDQVHI